MDYYYTIVYDSNKIKNKYILHYYYIAYNIYIADFITG